MGLKEKMDEVSEVMQRTKEEWVATDPDNTDIAIYLHFYRGDELVAAVQCPLDRDTALKAGQLGAAGFCADTMGITFESYHSDLPESPITGKRWVPKEMQFIAETVPDAFDKGWVSECITTTLHERGGGYILHSKAYRIVDGKVEWKDGTGTYDISSDNEEGRGGGVMHEYLQHAMAMPTILEEMDRQAESDPNVALMNNLVADEEQRRYHIDVATFKAMGERKLAMSVVLTAEPGSRREEWLTERFGPPGTSYPID